MNKDFLKNKTVELVSLCRKTIDDGFSIVVTGHDMPDCDSIISAVMLCEMLARLGVTSSVKFGTAPDRLTFRYMKELGLTDNIRFDGFDDGDKLVLVDHHQTFYKNAVIACVDHHTTPPEPDFALNLLLKASSCARIIYDMALSCGVCDDWMEKITVYSVYLDTQSCQSSKFVKSDLAWLLESISRQGLDEEKLIKLGYCLNSLDESVNELSMYGYKKYEFNGKTGASTVIQIDTDDDGWDEKINKILRFLTQKMLDEGAMIWAFVVNMPVIARSDLYFIRKSGIEKVRLDRLASRSRDVVPVVKDECRL